MNYQDGMDLLSQCGLGMVLISDESKILEINEAGDRLLHGDSSLAGKSLAEAVPLLYQALADTAPNYINIGFGEYLSLFPAPKFTDLPSGTRLIAVRDSKDSAVSDMLTHAVNQISESIILCDERGRIFLFNDAAVNMDSMLLQDIAGKPITDIYTMDDGSDLAIPSVIRDKQPVLNLMQHYTTFYGKKVDIMSNNYPILSGRGVLGGFSVMQDWSQIDKLSRQVIDLQSKLIDMTSASRTEKKNRLPARYHFRDIIGNSGAMNSLIKKCRQVAKADVSVMIYGETGTGKELFAQSIHNASRRADGPFLAINCAAIPENLLESLLFGTEKGAYTGAEHREGLFEQANHGTLLLDEINSMNIALQSKLLRVLQESTVRHVGGLSEIHVDVRVISNTNVSPYQAIEENTLRRDLFYRLGVVNITVPPLRNRKEDIPLLAKCFMLNFNRKLLKNVREIAPEVLAVFYSYDWPGNVRELQHAIESAMSIMPDDASVITEEYIPENLSGGLAEELPIRVTAQSDSTLESFTNNVEYQMLCMALKENNGNISKTARRLGMSRQNVQYRVKRYGIDIPALLRQPE